MEVDRYDYTKAYETCPKCGGKMTLRKQGLIRVMDGNSVFECEDTFEHRFWQNMREHNGVIHFNTYSSATNFKSDANYKWDKKTEKWIEKL